MKKAELPRLLLAGFLLILLLPGCASQPPARESSPAVSGERIQIDSMDTSPRDGKLVFLGVAGIRSRRQESIDIALEDAARRVAIFKEVTGQFSTNLALGGRLLDYRAETNTSLYYDSAYSNYVEALEFDEDSDVFESENAIFVRVRYPGSLHINFRPSPPGAGSRPSWVDNPPETIGEYTAGVGYADRRHAHRDTITMSYENAIFSIIRSFSAVAQSQSIDYRGDGFFDVSSTIRQQLDARGRLNEFYVLETWTNPSDKTVWTLAIAKGSAF